MAKRPPRHPSCLGSASFDPSGLVSNPSTRSKALALLDQDDFAGAIREYFGIPSKDTYVYHAITSVTLPQVQHVVSLGGANSLHAWYSPTSPPSSSSPPDPLPPPTRQDIEAYTSLFSPHTHTPSALKALASNAKKGSIRASVAAHLASKRYIHPAAPASLSIPKKKPTAKDVPPNPYFDFWAWSCRNLEWAGPCPESERRLQSHHVLPVLMHHFGCAVPSYEALEVLRGFAEGRRVLDVGSGNGYWAFMLRAHGVEVTPVDSAQSEWRVNWIGDTVIADGAKFVSTTTLASGKQVSGSKSGGGGGEGGEDAVLLMVYPIVGGGPAGGVEGGFTRDLLAAYRGDTVAVVGTQNHNGYTSFRDATFDEYMAREQSAWTKVVQIPVPSFAGKDEALFVYQRGSRATRLLDGAGNVPEPSKA